MWGQRASHTLLWFRNNTGANTNEAAVLAGVAIGGLWGGVASSASCPLVSHTIDNTPILAIPTVALVAAIGGVAGGTVGAAAMSMWPVTLPCMAGLITWDFYRQVDVQKSVVLE